MPRTSLLIIEARFYEGISDLLLTGVLKVLDTQEDVEYESIEVPGALEIPAAIAFAKGQYDGFLALGCVIRGETSHYDTVCNESARGIMDLSINQKLAIANGILTCENHEQALDRADPKAKNKGASFAKAVLNMVDHKRRFS